MGDAFRSWWLDCHYFTLVKRVLRIREMTLKTPGISPEQCIYVVAVMPQLLVTVSQCYPDQASSFVKILLDGGSFRCCYCRLIYRDHDTKQVGRDKAKKLRVYPSNPTSQVSILCMVCNRTFHNRTSNFIHRKSQSTHGNSTTSQPEISYHTLLFVFPLEIIMCLLPA